MNLPNLITLSRIPMTFAIVGLMYQQWLGAPTLAFWLFIAGAVSDWLDGYLARKRGLVSNFGKFMDALTDKIMVIGLMVAFLDKDQLPMIYVLITLCREFLVSGMRMVAASKGVVVAADRGGKTKTVTQLIAIGFLLASPMIGQDAAHFISGDLSSLTSLLHTIGLVGFVIGTFLTMWSGYNYMRAHWKLIADDASR